MSFFIPESNVRQPFLKGFTLVETLVSMGLFLIVVSIAISAVVSVYSVSSRVQNTAGVSDSLGFLLHDVVRSARLSTLYSCGVVADGADDACMSSDLVPNAFSFVPRLQDGTDGPTITYRQNGTVIEKVIDGSSSQLTSGDLTIDNFNVQIFDALSGDERPSRALITVEGTYQKGTTDEVTYRYQTSVTQRIVE